MKKVLLPLIAFLALIASCKKNDAPAPKNILDQVVTKQGTDSVVTKYTYDAANRFVGEVANDPINNETYTKTLARDNSGRVTKITDVEASSTPGTTVTDFVYLGATDVKLKNGKSSFVQSGVTIFDSSAYEYSGTQVSKTSHYWALTGQPYAAIQYFVYTYDARGNIASVKFYQVGTPGLNDFTLQYTVTYTYDDKINPILAKDDALIEYIGNQYVCPNNITGLTFNSATTPANNFTAAITYEYRSDGRPTKSTTTIGGTSSVSTYTYR
jgi:YD repeat-containing protein